MLGIFDSIFRSLIRFYWVLFIVYFLICYAQGKIAVYLAKQRKEDENKWFWYGFFGGPSALLIIGFYKNNTSKDVDNKKEVLLPKMKFCENCGKEQKPGVNFCQNCGTKQ